MTEVVGFLQNAVAVAFVLLGLVTAARWIRHGSNSLGWLALAIILLAAVSGLGRILALLNFKPPLLPQISLIAFMASGYAVLRYRGALIPLTRRWHAAALVAMLAATGLYLVVQVSGAGQGALTAAGIALVFIWSAAVGEPIVRFWLVARGLPAVQAWRLRSLSIGFGGIVLVLVFAVIAGSLASSPVYQVVIELMVLAIVPLLYVSFSPPAWLRREWRATEEEGLRAFMEELLLGSDRDDAIANRALQWAMRLVGGASACLFDAGGKPRTSHGLDSESLAGLGEHLPGLREGVNRVHLDGTDTTLIALPVKGLEGSTTLVVLAGPFSPAFGTDDMTRVQQFMSAFITALDRRHLIVQLEESNARLKEASTHKSVFLANMSHELRTPLNAIIGFSELLVDAPPGQYNDASRKRFQEQILTSGRHLLGLINDILDLSKVEAGQMDLRLQPVAVAEIVEQVASTVEPLVNKKNIKLEGDAAPAGDMIADAGKLKQMLLNLVSNAIKFTPDGGTVRVTATRNASAVEISVSDTGIGISEADQKNIFKEFHQVDPGPGRKHEGTGLGLALTKRFAMLHGGDLRVQSRPNEGSVFTLTLPLHPLAPARVSAVDEAALLAGRSSGAMVLVVEDDPPAAELLTRQLASAGYRTTVVRTGTEALAKARELRPSAITLDIILPDIDGWEVMTKLKSDPRTSAIPVIVVSIVDNPELGVALGAVDYFVKPLDAKELIRRLHQFDFKRSLGKEDVNVLVVDDENANREWLTRVLEPAGFNVLSASGGREAIQLAKSRAPDLVLLDLMMPEVTGFDVVEALRSNEATQETPIMILTAMNLTEAEKEHLRGRVSSILTRGSVGASDIVSMLKRVIADHNGVSSGAA
jgi:signal transduction histidine kinase/DNA-binding response OmpR family regulator